jgi:hypothetical protein
MLFLPIARKLHLVFVLRGATSSLRTLRLPLNLLELDERGALAFATEAAARVSHRTR